MSLFDNANFDLTSQHVQYDLILDALDICARLQKAERARLAEETIDHGLSLMRLSRVATTHKGSVFVPPAQDKLLPSAFWDDLHARLRDPATDPLTMLRLWRLIEGARQIYNAYAPLSPAVKQYALWESESGLRFRERLRNYTIDVTRHTEVSAAQAKIVNVAFRLAAGA